MIVSDNTSTRELDCRYVDGIQVRLLWSAINRRMWVAVDDFNDGSRFAVGVREPERALDVFHHPYAYAAHYGIDTAPSRPTADVPVAA